MSARDRSLTEPASFASQEDLDPAIVDIDDVEELEAEGSRQGIGRRADRAPSDREHGLKTALALVDQPLDDHVRAQLERLYA